MLNWLGVHVGKTHVAAREVGFQAAPVGVPPPEGSPGDGMLTTRAFLVAFSPKGSPDAPAMGTL